MKLSNKIFFAACALGFAALIGEKISVRNAFANRQKVDFEPGYEEKNIKPFKVVVVDSRLEPNSELRIEKSDRFALASDYNFWKSADFSQRGDTIFIHQNSDKLGKLADPNNQDLNNYAKIVLLCPSGLTSVRSDISVFLNEIASENLQIEQSPNGFVPEYAKKDCWLTMSGCKFGQLRLASGQNARVIVDEKTTAQELGLQLRDSASVELNGQILGNITLDCGAKNKVSVSGDNLSKIKK